MSNILILYSGISLNCAPRVQTLYDQLSLEGDNVIIGGLVKKNDLSDNYNIEYVRLFSSSNYSLLKITSLLSSFLVLLARLIFKRNKFDKIYAINPVSGVLATFASLLTKEKVIYETQEVFIGTNHKFFSGRFKSFWYCLEKKIAERCHRFVATDEFRAKFLRRLYSIDKSKVDYMLNVPKRKFYIKTDLRKKYNFEQADFIVSYCGAIAENRALEDIIKAYSVIETDNTLLLLAGYYSENYRSKLDLLIKKLDLKNVVFTGKISNDELHEYMCLSDCTFALYESNCLNNRLNSPNKIFDAINLNVSLITTSTPLARSLEFDFKIITIKNNQPSEIVSALENSFDVFGAQEEKGFIKENIYTVEYQLPNFVRRVLRC